MQRVYVLEQTVAIAGQPLATTDAGEIMAWFAELDGVRCQTAGELLLLLGTSEAALAAARTVLRARFGDDLRLGPLRVRHAGFPLNEPVMDVFVLAAPSLGEPIRRELRRRRARILFTTVNETTWLIRAQATMRELLGFPAELRALAGERADHWITFNRWCPLDAPRRNGVPARVPIGSVNGNDQA